MTQEYIVGDKYISDVQVKKITSGFNEVIKENLSEEYITYDVIKFITAEYLDYVSNKNICL